jgi:hypothetical protein
MTVVGLVPTDVQQHCLILQALSLCPSDCYFSSRNLPSTLMFKYLYIIDTNICGRNVFYFYS